MAYGVRAHPTLPIFVVDGGSRPAVYTPGRLTVVRREDLAALLGALQEPEVGAPPSLLRVARELMDAARAAAGEWTLRANSPWEPECLTVHLGNRCNLACSYCYAATERRQDSGDTVPEPALRAAARLVAGHCRRKAKPFQLVVTGGGEPTMEWDLLERAVAISREAANAEGVAWRGYLATNGVASADRLRWLARNFDEIGLSCDGPPDIQERHRGPGTAAAAEAAARVFREQGTTFTVRATVTPDSFRRQREIVAWCADALGATRLRLEPVFRAAAGQSFRPEDAAAFVAHFLEAAAEADSRGCELTFPDVRLDELHGPHCNVSKDVLQLMPDGSVASCFLGDDRIGAWDPRAGGRSAAFAIPERCQDCINLLHCARGCPDFCAASPGEWTAESEFRCRVSGLLAEEWIRRAAGSADASRMEEDYAAAAQFYDMSRHEMPAPPWVRQGFEHSGRQVWEHLGEIAGQGGPEAALSIYIHVPFCDRRCGFCDCYSVSSSPRGGRQEAAFVRCLVAEIDAWAKLGNLSRRPVTTVHFGGGTPNHLTPENFASIVEAIRGHFSTSASTEWALESNSSLLDPARLEALDGLGFRRLHVGVQTLEEEVRRSIGRREPAAAVLSRLRIALDMGFITSVDLVYGLPRQSLAGFLDSIDRLAAIGVDGFSLYHLNVTARNRRFLERQRAGTPDPRWEYTLFHAAHQMLERAGYRKNHFVHFAGERDRNLYYRHAVRGEDLLAWGPSADGVLCGYRYRHPELAAYLAGSEPLAPAMQGGLAEPGSALLRRVAANLAGGGIADADLEALAPRGLPKRWRQARLLTPAGPDGERTLAANGSWLVGEMIQEIRRL